jgi:hypothetical protein
MYEETLDRVETIGVHVPLDRVDSIALPGPVKFFILYLLVYV